MKNTSATLSFQAESTDAFLYEIVPLLIKNYEEVDGPLEAHRGLEFAPDFQRYMDLEEAGVLKVYTARKDGKLVGYLFLMVGPSPRFKGETAAHQEIFYIDPDHRGFGMSFLAWAETQLRFAGVTLFYQYTKRSDSLYFGHILKRKSYHLLEECWMKRLDSDN